MHCRGVVGLLLVLGVLACLAERKVQAGAEIAGPASRLDPRFVPPRPPEPPMDLAFVAGVDLIYGPGDDGGPALVDFQISLTSRTLQLGYFELRSVLPYLPIANKLEHEYGATQACYLCASVGFRVAKVHPDAYLTVGLDYQWVYLGAGGEDDYKTPAAGGELGLMAQRGPAHLNVRLAVQALLLDGYAGIRQQLDISGWWHLVGPLGAYGHLGWVRGTLNGTDGFADYDFGGPVVQLGLGWTN